MSKESPLSSVGVAGQDQVDGIGDERIILRMVREQDVIAGSGTVLFKPPCLRLMQRSMNRASDSADAFLTWVAVGAARFGSESSIICNVA